MALPICMLEPISLLEVLSLSLNHIHLLYTEEYTIQSMITISFSTKNNKSRVYHIVQYILASFSLIPSVRYCIVYFLIS